METTNDSLLEMYLHGDPPPALRKRAEDLLATAEGKERLKRLRESDAAILQELPAREWSDKIRRRMADSAIASEHPRSAMASRPWALASGLAFACAMVAVVAVWKVPAVKTESVKPVAAAEGTRVVGDSAAAGTNSRTTGERAGSAGGVAKQGREVATESVVAKADVPDDGLRTKGEVARMRIHRIEVGSTETVAMRDGDQAAAGTTLQVALLAGARSNVAVMSVDGAGQVSRHIPETGDSSISVKDPVQAAHSFQIDDAPGFERFVLVESDKPFALSELESLLAKVRGGKTIPVRSGWSIQSLFVKKPEARK